MVKDNFLRNLCGCVLGLVALCFCISVYETHNGYLAILVVGFGSFQAFLNRANLYSSKLSFEHVLSTGFAIISTFPIVLVSASDIQYGWAFTIVALPTVLSLLSPILYSLERKFNWCSEVWQNILMLIFTIIAILFAVLFTVFSLLESYIALQMMILAWGCCKLPNTDEIDAQET